MQKSASGTWGHRGALAALLVVATLAAGCGGGGGGGKSASAAGPASGSSGGSSTHNAPPTISGKPATQANVGASYDLTPSAQDADGDTLAFSIENRPNWAAFSTATGKLSGTPGADSVGTTPDIVISVSDGANRVTLPAFSITVVAANSRGPVPADAVVLSWDVPTETESGALLGDLTGYRIHYGKSLKALTQAIEVPSAGSNTFMVSELPRGTYYFAVRAVSDSGESELSNVIKRTVG
jgi:hypothetical protein